MWDCKLNWEEAGCTVSPPAGCFPGPSAVGATQLSPVWSAAEHWVEGKEDLGALDGAPEFFRVYRRGLEKEAAQWKWSSFRHYAFHEAGVVEIESEWTARDREVKALELPPRIFNLCPRLNWVAPGGETYQFGWYIYHPNCTPP